MNTFKRQKRVLVDRKNAFVYAFWMLVNRILISLRFKDFQIVGRQNLPESGPFLLVSNHITRWDGLIVYELIGRPANFMVSPNELKGMQGAVLASMGSFPADPRADLISHAMNLFAKGEGIVVFPEGNIYRDNATHQFKTGAAKIAMAAAQSGIDLPIIPVALNYADEGKVAQVVLGQPISTSDYLQENSKTSESNNSTLLRALSDRLHREVCYLRAGLGSVGDRLALFIGPVRRRWSEIARITKSEIVIVEATCADSSTVADHKSVRLSVPLPELKVC